MMKFSQNDPRWSWMKIGKTNLTIGDWGCYLVCLAMIAGITPDKLNRLFTDKKVYTPKGLIDNEKAYPLCGLTFLGKSQERPKDLCFASTDYFASAEDPDLRHFFVLKPTLMIVDPLTGQEGVNKYAGHIVSYRLFKYGNDRA